MIRFPLPLCAVLVALVALPGLARADDCEDDFLECKDDCLIQYGGSIRVEQKKKYDKCLKKCTKSSRRCTEHAVETSTNQLEEGALKGTPTSDQVDSSGMPESKKKKKKASAEPEARSTEDDAAASDEPAPKKDAIRDDEVPKSSRTTLKVEEPKSPPPETKKAEEPRAEAKPAKAAEPDVIRMTPKKDDGKSTGDDLRDDGPRAKTSPPPKSRRRRSARSRRSLLRRRKRTTTTCATTSGLSRRGGPRRGDLGPTPAGCWAATPRAAGRRRRTLRR